VSTESLNRTSNVAENPSQAIETSGRVNVDVLKQRLLEESKKEKKKRRILSKEKSISGLHSTIPS